MRKPLLSIAALLMAAALLAADFPSCRQGIRKKPNACPASSQGAAQERAMRGRRYQAVTAFIDREKALWGVSAVNYNADGSVTLIDGRQTRYGALWRMYDAKGNVVSQVTLRPPPEPPRDLNGDGVTYPSRSPQFCVLSDGRQILKYEFQRVWVDYLRFGVKETRADATFGEWARQSSCLIKPTNGALKNNFVFPAQPVKEPEPDPLGIYRVDISYSVGNHTDTAMGLATAAAGSFNITNYVKKLDLPVYFDLDIGKERADGKLEIKKSRFRLMLPFSNVTVSNDGNSRKTSSGFRDVNWESDGDLVVESGKPVTFGPTPEGVSMTLKITRVGAASHLTDEKARRESKEKLPPPAGSLGKYRFKLTYTRNGFSDTLSIGLKDGKGEVVSAAGNKSFKILVNVYGSETNIVVQGVGKKDEPIIEFVLNGMKENLEDGKINVKYHGFGMSILVTETSRCGNTSISGTSSHSIGCRGGCVLEPGQPLKLGELPNGALSATLTAEPLEPESRKQ